MAPLYTDKLINYFKDIGKPLKRGKPKYDDYIFPFEITAEYIADKFGVSRTAVLRKLKAMEKDDIIVSKKGNVEGKPRKRLVFFLKEEIFETYTEKIDQSSEYSEFKGASTRERLYERYDRILEIEANGDCHVTMEYTIRNISDMDITEIPLPKFRFDTYEAVNMFDRLSRIVVNGNVLPYSSDGLRYFKKSKFGQIYDLIKSPISKHHSEVVYVIPLEENLKPGDTIEIKLTTHLSRSHVNLYEFEYSGFNIHEITMFASMKIIAPKNHTIRLLKRYENSSYKRGLIVKDANSEMRKPDLEEKVELPRVSKRQINWTIEKPAVGYRYIIPFFVIKNEK